MFYVLCITGDVKKASRRIGKKVVLRLCSYAVLQFADLRF